MHVQKNITVFDMFCCALLVFVNVSFNFYSFASLVEIEDIHSTMKSSQPQSFLCEH